MPSFLISFFIPNVYTNIITRVAIDNSIPSFIFAGINVNSISFVPSFSSKLIYVLNTLLIPCVSPLFTPFQPVSYVIGKNNFCPALAFSTLIFILLFSIFISFVVLSL